MMVFPLISALTAVLFSLTGQVKDNGDGSVLPTAAVIVENDGKLVGWTTSGEDGSYRISGLKEGVYTVKVTFIGYKDFTRRVSIEKDTFLNILMNEDRESLDEVVVSAIENRGVTASTKIGEDAIRHIQPSSFADLLELLPGGISKDPVLSSPQLINLRSANALTDSDYATSALGTRFIMDGRPINNDANLQSTPAYSNYGSSYVNFGTDMREISTEDIEKVEIVRGITSVKYGDLTSGLVNIVRKRGGNDLHARFKSDMKSKLFYVGKGFEYGNAEDRTTLNLSLNFLDSRADPRQNRQNWKRLTSSIRAGKDMAGDNFRHSISLAIDYTGSFDNEKSDTDLDITDGGVPIETYKSIYNKFNLSGRHSMTRTDTSDGLRSWENTLSFSYERDLVDRWKSVSLGKATPVSTSLEPGEHDALVIPAKYEASLQVDGRPLYGYAQSSATFAFGVHHISTGLEWNMAKNLGKGSIFDTSRPFSTSMNVRPRPYSAIPATHQISAFVEDNASVPLGEFILEGVVGTRIEMMAGAGNDYDINFKPYLDPRANIRLSMPAAYINGSKLDAGIYAGAGYHTKFPTMDMLFPDPIYGSRTQLNYWPVEENLRRVNLLVYRIDPTNTSLGAARNLKWEIGADMSYDGNTFSIDVFQEDMTSGFRYDYNYISLISKTYDVSTIDKNTLVGPPQLEDLTYSLDTTLVTYSYTTNGSRTLKRGLEFTFASKRIKSLNTRIHASGAWFRTQYSNSVPEYYKPSVTVDGEVYPYIGVYEMNDGSFYDSMTSNLMLDTQIPSLGLIFTTSFQCQWFSGHKSMPTSKYPVSYIDKSGKVLNFDKDMAADDPLLRHLIREYTASLYQYQRVPFAMNVNLKIMKKLYHDKVSVSLYVNRIFDVTPNYYRGDALIRRSVTPYFGMELDFKL